METIINDSYLAEKRYTVERLQALVLSSLFLFIISAQLSGSFATKVLGSALYMAGITLFSILLYLIIVKKPNFFVGFRKTIMVILDISILTEVIFLFDKNGIFFLPLYVFLVMWNGLRLGLNYFFITIFFASISWIVLLIYSPFWSSHSDILATFAMTTMIIPLFYLRFITKIHKENHSLNSQLHKVTKDAFHDALTSLMNRKSYDKIVKEMFKTKEPFGLMFIDLNKFKAINDTYGHDAGDEVLVEVSKRLMSVMSEDEYLFRLGGDEFVIISKRKKAFLPKFIKEIEDSVIGLHTLATKDSVMIELSIGIAIYPDDSRDAMLLPKYADEAMYKAKKEPNIYHKFYNEII